MTTRKRRSSKARIDETPEPIFDRRLIERQLAAVGRLLASEEFGSIDDANAFLEQALAGGALPDPGPATPLEEAQEVIYQAMESTGKRRVELARKALSISPDCADAYVLLAQEEKDPREALGLFRQGMEAGERALGPEAFTELAGDFWGVLETRPYMRALQGVTQILWYVGERQEAIGHAQEMLRLNPGDNQGMRYLLAGWLLETGDDDALEHLLAQFPDEWSATWAYTRALLIFRRKGAGKAADAALKRALETNPHVPLYLLGLDPLPRQLPGYYSPGDKNEAVTYLTEAGQGWMETPEAVGWLAENLIRLGAASIQAGQSG